MEDRTASFRVLLTRNHNDAKNLKAPYVIVTTSSRWNDFGEMTRCEFTAKSRSGATCTGYAMLAFLDEEQSPIRVLEKLNGGNPEFLFDKKNIPPFFTMLPDLQSYRSLVEALGIDEAKNVLLSLNEIVAARHYGPTKQWLTAALRSRAFNYSFMRDSGSHYVFENAASILSGVGNERVGNISKEMNLSFQLGSFSNRHDLRFEFVMEGPLPKRMCVIIGKNGVGKSQALCRLAKAALKDDRRVFHGVNGERVLINRILAVAPPGDAGFTFPPPPKRGARIEYKRLQLARSGKKRSFEGMGRTLISLEKSVEAIKGQRRWELFMQAVGDILPVEEIAVPLIETDTSSSYWAETAGNRRYTRLTQFKPRSEQASLDFSAAIDPKGDLVRLVDGKAYSLSSGQRTFLQFAAQICLHIENGTLVLMDEPETHLHPNLITDLVRLLDSLLEATGSAAILATHSPFLVREVPRSQVLIMQGEHTSDHSLITISTPRLRTLGAEVGNISFFIFEDEISSVSIERLRRALHVKNINSDAIISEIEDEMSLEALMRIRRSLDDEKGSP